MKPSLSCHRVTASRTDPGVTSELARDLAGGDVPQDHRLIRAAGAELAVVIGTVETAKEKQTLLSQHFLLTFLTHCGGGCDNSLTCPHPEPRIHDRCTSSAGSLGSRSTALEIYRCHKSAGSSHRLSEQGDMRQRWAWESAISWMTHDSAGLNTYLWKH